MVASLRVNQFLAQKVSTTFFPLAVGKGKATLLRNCSNAIAASRQGMHVLTWRNGISQNVAKSKAPQVFRERQLEYLFFFDFP